MTDTTRALLADAARRGADYLESLDRRPVFPREADVERLRAALAGDMPASPTRDAEVLAFLDEHGTPATVASAGGRPEPGGRRLWQRRPDEGDDRRLQEAGECWCGGTRWRGREAMRVSVSAWATTQADMKRTLRAILAAAESPG